MTLIIKKKISVDLALLTSLIVSYLNLTTQFNLKEEAKKTQTTKGIILLKK